MSSPTQSAAEESATEAGNLSPGQSDAVRATQFVAAPVQVVWERLISSDGTQALLGPGAALGSKGESWRSEDGPHGVVRSYHPLEQLRVSWHEDDDSPPSLVDLHLVPDGDGTRLELVHEKVAGGAQAEHLRSRWDGALERLAADVTR